MAQEKFRFSAVDPAAALARFVAHYWFVSWDLRGQDPYEQHVLPYPSVNMTFMTGRCRIAGVPRGRFSEVLRDAGRVFGVRFRPGGFRPFLGAPVSAITDRFVAVEAVFGAPGRELADAVVAADDAQAVAITERFLLGLEPLGRAPDPMGELVAAMVAHVMADPAVTRVDKLAREFGFGMRRLQRLFAEYVGVGRAGPGRDLPPPRLRGAERQRQRGGRGEVDGRLHARPRPYVIKETRVGLVEGIEGVLSIDRARLCPVRDAEILEVLGSVGAVDD